jgi:tRNA-2-methylthio-N6-dimethylallyladenosine synthase
VEKLAAEGFRQVTLLGQNVNSYSYGSVDFPDLLQEVSKVDGIERVRFTSPHPKDFPAKLLKVIATNPRVCKHVHFPLQAGNDRILAAMHRTYTGAQYLKIVRDIRREYPAMVLTTDIIVGFPTETPEEFLDTVNIVREVEFDSAFIFKYSERAGTAAAEEYEDDVTDEEKKRRIVELVELQKQISLRKNRAHIGQVHEVLIEKESTKKSESDIQGRNDGNKIVIIPGGKYRIGQFVDVRITDASANVLKGEVVSEVM